MPTPYIIELPDREYDLYNDAVLVEVMAPSLHHREVIVDFKRVRFIDSTSLRVLIGFRKRRAAAGFPPKRFIHVSSGVRTILRVSQLDKIWPVFDTMEQAIASFDES